MWLTRFSIQNPVMVTMAMVALCVLGIFSYARLSVEQMPDISLPMASIEVAYAGATPEVVEREVTRVIEEGVNSVANVRHISSRSSEGRSEVTVEFQLDTDMGRAMQDLRDRLAALQGAFPKEAEAPVINSFANDNAQPVAVLALTSSGHEPRTLSVLADQMISRRLQRVEGVARVDVSGLTAREVHIDLDPARLRSYGITPSEISVALGEVNSDQVVGVLSSATRDSPVWADGRVREPQQFADLVVGQRGGLALTLGDVGHVAEREKEAESLSRLDGRHAITFNVYKRQGANVVATGDALKQALPGLRKDLPADVRLELVVATSDEIRNELVGLRHTLVEGALLTVAIVFLFLQSWRSTVITGLTLPISVLASFIAVLAFGYTLNFMTMMALSLCIGLLIDDAIVVRENIARHLQMGKSHALAARDGTEEIGLAVMATTFAICAVFVPVAFMGGIVGKFFRPFGVTVVAAVLVSLVVSFTLDPMLSSVWQDNIASRLRRLPVLKQLVENTERLLQACLHWYEASLRWAFSEQRFRLPLPVYGQALQGRRRWRSATLTPRGVVLLVSVSSFLLALMLVPLAGSEFTPKVDQGFTQINLRMPTGASLARSDAKVRQVERFISELPEVKSVSTSIGGQRVGSDSGSALATLNITLVDRSKRSRTQAQVELAIREGIERIPGVDASIGFDRPIEVAILGNDPQALAQAVRQVAERLTQVPGIVDVDVSAKPALVGYSVLLKPGVMREMGLTLPQVGASLRAYVNGEVATHWTAPDGEQIDVRLRLPPTLREHVDQLRALPVAFAKDGTPIALEAIATIKETSGPEVIHRQDLQRRETVSAGVQGRPAGDVGSDVETLVAGMTLPPGCSFDIGGDTRRMQEALWQVGGALLLAVIFIYIVLASQFASFVQPLIIMASLPLSLIGVISVLLLWHTTLNVFSMIGFVMTMGLVTKNAILLVDFANQARRTGMATREALLQAGLTRMRPILMTTAAMVFGMLPLALAFTEGGEFQAPLGRAIIGGVLSSTLLTLIVVPVLYSYLCGPKSGDVPLDVKQ
jgi:hydrophobe/amphiphile efflux-1 (HAE1) family protein